MTMVREVSEDTPLLNPEPSETIQADHNAVYDRFTPRQKHVLLALVSWCGLIPRKYLLQVPM